MKSYSLTPFAIAALHIVVHILSPFTDASPIGWDFAVTLTNKIVFLDHRWRQVSAAAHEFEELSALAFDEAQEVIYFNNRQHRNSSIFSLRRDATAEHEVQRTGNESVAGIAYDPLNRNIFWADMHQSKIYFASIDKPFSEPKVLVDLTAEGGKPDGVALDICRRQLYWTNCKAQNSSVERIGLNGKGRKAIIKDNIDGPRGIVVDQLSDRLFWIDDKVGIFFAVESSRLDGSDRQLVVKDKHQEPIQLAITADTVYWTDKVSKAVWSYPKPTFIKPTASSSQVTLDDTQPAPAIKNLVTFNNDIYGIVARTGFYQHLQRDEHCASVVDKVKQSLDTRTNNTTHDHIVIDERVRQLETEYCFKGEMKGNFCVCQVGYKGARCEIEECHNFCVHGNCTISRMGFPKCSCQKDFYGERCEYYRCNGHCLNNGRCSVDSDSGELSCECRDRFAGSRCEHNLTDTCASYCMQLKENPDAFVPVSCQDICEELGNGTIIVSEYQHESLCGRPSVWTGTVIIVLVVGVVSSLSLVASIVHGLRLIYKPKRPHIKKTFVVRKQARLNSSSDTPLTNRPLATEQCEITIENCCNMNICETPCFDPKLVEQTFSARDRKAPCVKEDKKILIHSMDDDLLS